MDKNIETRGGVCLGIDKESFAPIAGALCALAAGIVDFVIRMFRFAGGSDHYTAAMPGLYLAIGIVTLLACIYLAVGVILVRAKILPEFFTATLAAPLAVAFLLSMIFGCLKNGNYSMTVEIVFFVFMLIAAAALAMQVFGRISSVKACILFVGVSALGLVCSFLPTLIAVFTPEVALSNLEDGISIYLPMTAMLAAVTCVSRGLEKAKGK